jgi:hypothetical protein
VISLPADSAAMHSLSVWSSSQESLENGRYSRASWLVDQSLTRCSWPTERLRPSDQCRPASSRLFSVSNSAATFYLRASLSERIRLILLLSGIVLCFVIRNLKLEGPVRWIARPTSTQHQDAVRYTAVIFFTFVLVLSVVSPPPPCSLPLRFRLSLPPWRLASDSTPTQNHLDHDLDMELLPSDPAAPRFDLRESLSNITSVFDGSTKLDLSLSPVNNIQYLKADPRHLVSFRVYLMSSSWFVVLCQFKGENEREERWTWVLRIT